MSNKELGLLQKYYVERVGIKAWVEEMGNKGYVNLHLDVTRKLGEYDD